MDIFLTAHLTTILYFSIAISIIIALIREYRAKRLTAIELEDIFEERKAKGNRFNTIPCSVKKFRRISCLQIKAD